VKPFLKTPLTSLHQNRAAVLTTVLLTAALAACTGTIRLEPKPNVITALGQLELSVGGTDTQTYSIPVGSGQPTGTLDFTRVPDSGGVVDDAASNARYLWVTYSVQNNSGQDLDNLTLQALYQQGSSLGGTAIKSVFNASNAAVTDAKVAQEMHPSHMMQANAGALGVDNARADFQAFRASEAFALQTDARAKNLIGALDRVLEYGFVARSNDGRRMANGGSGQITLSMRVPKQPSAALEPQKFNLTFVVANQTATRVTRGFEESTANASARATNAQEVALIGFDADIAGSAGGVSTVRLAGLRTGLEVVVPTRNYIMIDQFGYRPGNPKVAVISDPQTGSNSADQFVPSASLELRSVADDAVVLSAAPTLWNGGATQANSGDRGWWFDFSAISAPGEYYVLDPQNNGRSYPFVIGEDVYKNVLKAATKMFYYQRLGVAKQAQHAGANYTDGVSFAQDARARSVTAQTDASTERDLSGGWMDAGDTNKYVTFANTPIHQLLSAYQRKPSVFGDDLNIPESGNGVPDVLDEIKFELEWLKKMQNTDGGTLLKIGSITHNTRSPLSSDTEARYYVGVCSSSTINAAGAFAHAAVVLGGIAGQETYANDLRARAVLSWDHFQNASNPRKGDCDNQTVKAGDADVSVADQEAYSVVPAIYLFKLTGETKYGDYIKNNYAKSKAIANGGFWLWSVYEPQQGDALMYYTSLSNADSTVKTDIIAKKTQGFAGNNYKFQTGDLYRAFSNDDQFHWGSNLPRANIGNANMDALEYNLDSANATAYKNRALGMLHYVHGVNPLNKTYLSNMGALGAENSVLEMYHAWFAGGTKWQRVTATTPGPMAGYIVGGPNKNYAVDNTNGLTPPKGNPPQKVYVDGSNAINYTKAIWELSEPGIYYQSAYLRLLSSLVP
jgi:endoglucanase